MWRPFAKSKTKLTKCTHNNQQLTIFALKIEYYVKKQKTTTQFTFWKIKEETKEKQKPKHYSKNEKPGEHLK